jgi:phage portal protein BeeE
VFDGGAKLEDHPGVSPRELTMLEISQFNESRIAVLLGVPPFLVGLPSGSDSMTYSNVTMLFDFHDRQMLRPMDIHVMRALSFWALPRGQAVELNHDEYSRPSFEQRADAWPKLINAGVVTPQEVRVYERFQGETPESADGTDTTMSVITGGEQ